MLSFHYFNLKKTNSCNEQNIKTRQSKTYNHTTSTIQSTSFTTCLFNHFNKASSNLSTNLLIRILNAPFMMFKGNHIVSYKYCYHFRAKEYIDLTYIHHVDLWPLHYIVLSFITQPQKSLLTSHIFNMHNHSPSPQKKK